MKKIGTWYFLNRHLEKMNLWNSLICKMDKFIRQSLPIQMNKYWWKFWKENLINLFASCTREYRDFYINWKIFVSLLDDTPNLGPISIVFFVLFIVFELVRWDTNSSQLSEAESRHTVAKEYDNESSQELWAHHSL